MLRDALRHRWIRAQDYVNVCMLNNGSLCGPARRRKATHEISAEGLTSMRWALRINAITIVAKAKLIFFFLFLFFFS